jgi:polar amino acid transport system substrate-binding protein
MISKCFIIILFLFIILSKQIYATSTIKVCTEQSPPYVDADKDTGEVKGIDIDIFKKVFEKLRVKYSIEEMPWARCELSMKTGRVDVGIKVSKNPDREKFLYYPDTTVWDTIFVFFTNLETKKKYKINNYEDVKKNNLMVGVIHENSYNPDFWKEFPWIDKPNQIYNHQIEPSLNVETNLRKLNSNRIQLYPQDKSIGISTAKKLELKNITYYDFVIFQKPYGSCFSKASQFSTNKYKNIFDLMEYYNRELKKFKKKKEFNLIFKKYLK